MIKDQSWDFRWFFVLDILTRLLMWIKIKIKTPNRLTGPHLQQHLYSLQYSLPLSFKCLRCGIDLSHLCSSLLAQLHRRGATASLEPSKDPGTVSTGWSRTVVWQDVEASSNLSWISFNDQIAERVFISFTDHWPLFLLILAHLQW